MRLWREEAILNTLWWSLWCQDKVEWEDWLWCIPFQRATLQVQEEEDSTAAAPPPALAQPLSSMRRPLLCTLKIEFSTFLFQFAFLLFLSLLSSRSQYKKGEKRIHFWKGRTKRSFVWWEKWSYLWLPKGITVRNQDIPKTFFRHPFFKVLS